MYGYHIFLCRYNQTKYPNYLFQTLTSVIEKGNDYVVLIFYTQSGVFPFFLYSTDITEPRPTCLTPLVKNGLNQRIRNLLNPITGRFFQYCQSIFSCSYKFSFLCSLFSHLLSLSLLPYEKRMFVLCTPTTLPHPPEDPVYT